MSTNCIQDIKKLHILFACITLISCSNQKSGHDASGSSELKEISFLTADSITVYGDLLFQYPTYPTILLFHQGGSNARAEYKLIIKRLLDEVPKLNILAIDQRSGGQIYGSFNRTVFHLSPYNNHPMCEAYSDLQASLKFVSSREVTGPIVLWGSSYSGSLAIQLAAKNEDKITAVLAFSPASGGPMTDCKPDEYIRKLKTPLLALRPRQEMQLESVQQQFQLLNKYGHQTYTAQHGVHGSSMMVRERVDNSVESNWDTVLHFIRESITE